MRVVVNQLQSAAAEPPGHMENCPGIRSGPNTPGWGTFVPAIKQPATPVHKSERDQPPAADVTGRVSVRIFIDVTGVMITLALFVFLTSFAHAFRSGNGHTSTRA